MKYILISLLFLSSCKGKETIHTPKWQWLIYGDNGGLAIDTSLCSADLRLGDTVYVISKSDGSIIFKYIHWKELIRNSFKDTIPILNYDLPDTNWINTITIGAEPKTGFEIPDNIATSKKKPTAIIHGVGTPNTDTGPIRFLGLSSGMSNAIYQLDSNGMWRRLDGDTFVLEADTLNKVIYRDKDGKEYHSFKEIIKSVDGSNVPIKVIGGNISGEIISVMPKKGWEPNLGQIMQMKWDTIRPKPSPVPDTAKLPTFSSKRSQFDSCIILGQAAVSIAKDAIRSRDSAIALLEAWKYAALECNPKIRVSGPFPRPIPDSTIKPSYSYFLRHDNPQRYYQALDSVNIISGLIGKAMLYEDALYWLNARARNLNILYYESRVDSVKVGGKP